MINNTNDVRNMTTTDMLWKPLYPNNMIDNEMNGYYCIVIRQHLNGTYSGRKYTILYQRKEIEPGTGLVDSNNIDRYVLFEKTYSEINGPLDYPEPSRKTFMDWTNTDDTLNAYDLNDPGNFIYAYETLELAQQRALAQYKHMYEINWIC